MHKATIQSKKANASWLIREKPAHVMRVNMAEGLPKPRAPRAHSGRQNSTNILDILVLDDNNRLRLVSLSHAKKRGRKRVREKTQSEQCGMDSLSLRRTMTARPKGARKENDVWRRCIHDALAWVVSRCNDRRKIFYLVNSLKTILWQLTQV